MSVKKNNFAWIGVGLIVLLVVVAAVYFAFTTFYARTTVRLGDGVFRARIAETPEAHARGLSGQTLAPDEAMLFVFAEDGTPGIWMKGMKMPIDVVWLGSDKKVVHIERDMRPESYPKVYTPKAAARYVVELSAGTTSSRAIEVGTQAYFTLPSEGATQ